jgi:hypothetical protein
MTYISPIPARSRTHHSKWENLYRLVRIVLGYIESVRRSFPVKEILDRNRKMSKCASGDRDPDRKLEVADVFDVYRGNARKIAHHARKFLLMQWTLEILLTTYFPSPPWDRSGEP